MTTRGRRAGVEDRWNKTVRDEHGNTKMVPSGNYGKGSRWRARYVDDSGKEHAEGFSRKTDAQQWLNKQVSDQVTGTWTDPALSGVTFGAMAQRRLSTKATRSAKTVAGYSSCSIPSCSPGGAMCLCGMSDMTIFRWGHRLVGGRVGAFRR